VGELLTPQARSLFRLYQALIALRPHGLSWRTILSTEDAAFCTNGRAPKVEITDRAVTLRFASPAAIALRGTRR
jgi:hypothetical protein